jgi:ubiquinone/menaquinone biosynthesis C-methylase UbiE
VQNLWFTAYEVEGVEGNMLQKIFAINRKLCDTIEPLLPQVKMSPEQMRELYKETVAKAVKSKPDQVIVDAGGGKVCLFAKCIHPASRAHIIAVDASEELLKRNRDVEDKRVADLAQGNIPLEADEADVIASSWLLEHLQRPEHFFEDSRRVLKPGGYFIHLLPCKFAPFALINQALPGNIRLQLLHFFDPISKQGRGFDAFYYYCYYSGINMLLQRYGFEVVEIRLGYYQSWYFKFFLPLFLLSALYELLIQSLRVKNLAPYVLIVARKK